MRNVSALICAIAMALLVSCSGPKSQTPTALSEHQLGTLPGAKGEGAVLLPNQWWLRPVGKQLPLGDFPVNIALHPAGKFAAILHCGYGQHEIAVADVADWKIVSRVNITEAFYGLAFSPDGKELFCSGAGDETLHAFSFSNGYLTESKVIKLRDAKIRGVPVGIAVAQLSGGAVPMAFVANVWGHRLSGVNTVSGEVIWELPLGTNIASAAETSISSAGTNAPDLDAAAITKRAEAALEKTEPDDPFPYACVVDAKRQRVYVSLWAQASVAVVDIASQKVVARWQVEEHPNEMLLTKSGKYLFVANANRNSVTVLDAESGRRIETLLAELQPNSPPGSTPNSLALAPDEKLLFVANATINALAVFDVSQLGKSHSLGFIPVGWYPTSVRVTPDGKKLLVANGKGLTSRANRYGPQPGKDPPASVREYIGGLMQGTLSLIDIPAQDKFEEQMKKYTAQAYRCLPAKPSDSLQRADLPIPFEPGQTSPIQYCIYIVKENRTYDQMLGDMPEGNGDSALCLFPEKVTPNHHQLAREFVLLDNFYVDGEVSADGHEWTMGAYATDFVEKSWPLGYGHNKSKKFPYPSEGNFPIATPAGGYLWDRAKEAGVSYRSYGEFVANPKKTNAPGTAKVPGLKDHIDPWYWSFDTDYLDQRRADRFISELARFEREGDMPRLQILRLPNDHTSGTTAGKYTPTAAVADNDLALGRVIEAVSHSKFWAKTAIFVIEDDAQNGPDHVDAHRSIAFVISPYVKRRSVDSTMYSTSSMLRTMELILGLKPMSQFDAAAMPMFKAFQSAPDLSPYQCLPTNVDIRQRNTRLAWGSKLSGKMDFTKEDAADDILLNEIVWRSVRGPDSPMPAPTRAAFFYTSKKKADLDD